MQVQINPADFARIMALPIALRHDVLEFLGSTPVAATDFDRVLHSLTARIATKERRVAGEVV